MQQEKCRKGGAGEKPGKRTRRGGCRVGKCEENKRRTPAERKPEKRASKRARSQGLKRPKREERGRRRRESAEGREEGGAEGRRGWGLPRQQSQRLQPPARSLALSARSRLPGSGLYTAPAPAGDPEASPAPGHRTARLAGLSPGHAAEAGRWLGGVRGD